jgi:hypothetical protein
MAGARRSKVVSVVFLVGLLCGMGWGPAQAEESGADPDAKTEEPHWVISIRGGAAQATQDHVSNAVASLGGAGSLQFLYQFSPYFRFGLTVDGQQQAVDVKNGAGTFGDLLTVAVMPTIEMRPFQTTTAIPLPLSRPWHEFQHVLDGHAGASAGLRQYVCGANRRRTRHPVDASLEPQYGTGLATQ